MQTTLTGHMDGDMVGNITKALERFSGREVKVTIELLNGKRSKAVPPNTHQSKHAPSHVSDFDSEEIR